jgi:low temperature requirement protein LtrA
MLALTMLWWAWVAYSWLTNEIDPEEGVVRLVMFAAMAAMLVASLATPHAFGADGLVFALAYTIVRVLHLVLYQTVPSDMGVREAVRRISPTAIVAVTLLIVAGVVGGSARTPLWIAALLVDLSGVFFGGVEGWHVSAGHFAERHGLIVLIALGESIVSIGAASRHALDGPTVVAAVLGIAVAGAMWWIYFDVVALVAERKLRSLTGTERNRMARDSYSYIHLVMVAGVVLSALGIKTILGDLHVELHGVGAFALCGGPALYLAGHVLFRLRNLGTLNPRRLIAGCVLLALWPVATATPPLLALALVVAVLWTLIAYEAIRFREARQRVRHHVDAGG